ncbi:MAG: hypothetical protein H8E32_04215 [Nitrospinae bacterium]|nr:hypothetical protein [Nitrospinota bacterium]
MKRDSSELYISYYLDSREYNTMNIQTSTNKLPLDIFFWGFVDIHSDQNHNKGRFDLTRYFIEYRLSRPVGFDIDGLSWELEYNDSNDGDNSVARFGVTYKHTLPFLGGSKSWIQWRIHPYETDGSGAQVSAIYRFWLMKGIYISGFIDYNIEKDAPDRWLGEPQLNFVLDETFDLIFEGRINQYEEASSSLDGYGVALGVKVKF